jgi:hypothetical protein
LAGLLSAEDVLAAEAIPDNLLGTARHCGLLHLGHVAHRSDHQHAVRRVAVGQRDVHRELGAISSLSADPPFTQHQLLRISTMTLLGVQSG